MRSFLFLFLFFICASSKATLVSGKVTDDKNNPIPFASIFLKSTTAGTTTNAEGMYSLDVPVGKHQLVFKFIGYKMHEEAIEVGTERIILNVKMQEEQVKLQEIVVTADAEDPAYAVIRQAIKKRKFYLNQVDAFSCDVYIKGVQRITKFPEKIMGVEINEEGQIDTATGIVYLSESVSKFNFKRPDKIKEEMISSKVSGDNQAFSYNQASDMLFNFYENVLEVDGLSERGFISPISNNALLSYKYKLLGTFFENGQMINKIQVIPIRRFDPVFKGIIYIMENSWRIHSIDVMLTKDAQIDFVDTLLINQIHLPVEGEIWMPFSNKFTFSFGILGIKGNGMYTGVNSNYIIDPDYPKKFFTNEVMKVVEGANEKDTAYWKDTRPVPLTTEEVNDYRKRDSLSKIRSSKPYLDSLDKKENKFKFSNLFFGYTYSQRYKKQSFYTSALIENVRFNTVQGMNAGIRFTFSKAYEEKKKRLDISTQFDYGFADKRPLAGFRAYYAYKQIKFASVEFTCGRIMEQINRKEPISPLVNTIYTLLREENYMKLFLNDFVGLTHRSEIINGVMLTGTVEYSDRHPLLNHSDFKFVDRKEIEYTSNDPYNPEVNTYSFERNQSFDVSVELRLRYKQRYYTRPNEKFIIGSKYPALNIRYRKAIKGIFGSDTDMDVLKIYVVDRIDLKLFGNMRYHVSAGKFLSSKNVPVVDYQHFLGNQTIYSDFDLTRFNLLPYYAYSSKKHFIEAHVEHNFGGFILNKIPLIRRLKLHEIGSFHYLSSNTLPQYTEFAIGIKRLFARVDFVTSYAYKQKLNTGFRFGLTF